MKKLYSLIAIAVLATVGAAAFGDSAKAQLQPVTKNVYIGPERVDCTGAAPQKCYQYKENYNDSWQLLYSSIEGFDYEEGFIYELQVEATAVPNPPADASSMRYKLLKVLSKLPAVPPSIEELELPASVVGKTWSLVSLQRSASDIENATGTGITFMFDAATSKASGSGGCNRYFGEYEIGPNNALEIEGIDSTRMACTEPVMKLETDYFNALSKVVSWSQDDPNRLQLQTNDGNTLSYIVGAEPGMPKTGGGRIASTVLGALLALAFLATGLFVRTGRAARNA